MWWFLTHRSAWLSEVTPLAGVCGRQTQKFGIGTDRPEDWTTKEICIRFGNLIGDYRSNPVVCNPNSAPSCICLVASCNSCGTSPKKKNGPGTAMDSNCGK